MEFEAIVDQIMQKPSILIKCVLSKNWSMRPIQKKDELLYQITKREGAQEFHENMVPKKALAEFAQRLPEVKQAQIYTTEADYQILQNKKGLRTILKKPPSQSLPMTNHNRTKNYLLQEGEPLLFLVELGIMNAEGRVYPAKRDKFLQINRFLEMVSQITLPSKLFIADMGCGKAYLTFSLYHYLTQVQKRSVSIYGCDVKEGVMSSCSKLARKCGFDSLFFQTATIEAFDPKAAINMVIALHACDTATDDALIKALKWNAEIILVAPCCQHELRSQVRADELKPLLKHGIFKEHFASLVTDAARAQFLESKGYKVDAIEFIDPEHTPKNILIRAVKDENVDRNKASEIYEGFKAFLKIKGRLDK